MPHSSDDVRSRKFLPKKEFCSHFSAVKIERGVRDFSRTPRHFLQLENPPAQAFVVTLSASMVAERSIVPFLKVTPPVSEPSVAIARLTETE